jgi:hypothetical protein
VRHPSLAPVGGGKARRGQFEFSLPSHEQILMQASDGQTSIAAIVDRLGQPVNLGERRELARVFFRRMWRLGHLFYRTA